MEKKEEEKGIFGIGLAGQEEKRRKSEREGGGRTWKAPCCPVSGEGSCTWRGSCWKPSVTWFVSTCLDCVPRGPSRTAHSNTWRSESTRENLKPDYRPTIRFRIFPISLVYRVREIVYLTRLWIIVSISCAIIERERERKREEKTVEYCARGEITIFKTSRCEEKEKVCRSIYVHRINSISIFGYKVYRWNNICIVAQKYPFFLFCNSSFVKKKKKRFISLLSLSFV